MTVRIVTGDAVLQPQRIRYAEVVAEDLFHLLARKTRIAGLCVAEQALFCGQQRSAAVDVNASALQHDAAPAELQLNLEDSHSSRSAKEPRRPA